MDEPPRAWHDTAMRLKALFLWFLFPSIMYVLALTFIQLNWGGSIDFTVLWNQAVRILLSPACIFTACMGTLILWLLPLRKAVLSAFVGFLLGASGILLWAKYEMTFHGGFENNIGIVITAGVLFLPSCAAGAYAGILRSRDLRRAYEGESQAEVLKLGPKGTERPRV